MRHPKYLGPIERISLEVLVMRADQACGAGWEGQKGFCRRSKKVWKTSQSGTIATGGFNGLEPGKQPNLQESQERSRRISRLADVLEEGRFSYSTKDPERVRYGKAGALTALRDAKNPRVGLVAAKNDKGEPIGFLSYKPGRTSIEIQNLGTDQSQKGIGRELFNSLIHIAAKSGKGLSAASIDDAVSFYEKMGMKREGENAMFMSPADVLAASKKNKLAP